MIRPPKREDETAADSAAVDSLLGSAPESEESEGPPPAMAAGPGDEMDDDMDDELGGLPAPIEGEEPPAEDPEVLVADLKATIAKLEQAVSMLG